MNIQRAAIICEVIAAAREVTGGKTSFSSMIRLSRALEQLDEFDSANG